MAINEDKPIVQHLEQSHLAGVDESNINELQQQIDKIALLSEEDFKAEERKLVRKVRRPSCPIRSVSRY